VRAKMKKVKKILYSVLTVASTVGMIIWSWMLWKDFFNPAIEAFGPIQPALTRLRFEIGKRIISGVVLFGLWLAGVFGLSRARKRETASVPKRELGG
jgi:TRAP-type C4-dicarboxylate transport system permease small subunit